MASVEGGLTMGVQEEDAQVEPVLPEPFPEPFPEPLVVYKEGGVQRGAGFRERTKGRMMANVLSERGKG